MSEVIAHLKPSQQLYIVSSFTALYVVIWCSTTGQVSYIYYCRKYTNFCQFPVVVVVVFCCAFDCILLLLCITQQEEGQLQQQSE